MDQKPTFKLQSYLGSYYLEQLIAIGGMAEIYLARTKGQDGRDNHLVLKVIQPEFSGNNQLVKMLADEANVTVGLNHPNIVQTFDFGKIETTYFLSMEYVAGADFFQILKQLSTSGKALPIEAAVHIMHQTLCGLAYAHAKIDEKGTPLKIVHRDISPQNILISRKGAVKIVDFGIAKAANLTDKAQIGVLQGKLVYMSPEQAWGDQVDQRTDIFSTGIVLYEALTMGSLYAENDPIRLLERVRMASIEPPSRRRSDLPPELERIVMKALSPRPSDRYQTAEEFSKVLMDYQHRMVPKYGEKQLGELIDSVLTSKNSQIESRTLSSSAIPMLRENYAHRSHSMILLAKQQSQESKPGPRRTTTGGVPLASSNQVPVLQLQINDSFETYQIHHKFTIGRAGDLRLGDARVSRRHAWIRIDDNALLLEDLGSSNGTYLNDQRIGEPRQLRPGDVIRISKFRMLFELADQPVETPQKSASTEEPSDYSSSRKHLLSQRKNKADHLTEPPVKKMDHQDSKPQNRVNSKIGEKTIDGATVTLCMGNENLSLMIGQRLPLSHTITIGEKVVQGETAALVKRPSGYWLEPFSEKVCVLHNGKKLTSPIFLHHGDKIQVGPINLEFNLPPEIADPQP